MVRNIFNSMALAIAILLGTIFAVPHLAMAQGAVAQGAVTGTYSVAGTNPNGSHYAGTVAVEATGDTYLVTWTVGGSNSVGRGVFLSTTLAVGGVLGDGGFVFAMSPKDGNLQGIWTDMRSGTTLGGEIWTRIK
jgi:hypothetical protein